MRTRLAKQFICVLFVVCVALVFCSCGTAKEGSIATPSIQGDVFDAGSISVAVPKGWKAFNGAMLLGDKTSQKSNNRICVFKGASSADDMHLFPGMMITYYPDGKMTSPDDESLISNYDNYTEMEDVTIGDYTWHACSASASGLPFITLWPEDGTKISVIIWTSTENSEISIEDPDVKDIIISIDIHDNSK